MTRTQKLLSPDQAESSEPYFLLCSGCRQPCTGDEAHVIPHWNDTAEDFLTTYRCEKCWKQALNETRVKVGSLDAELCEKFCKFLERHRFTDVDVIRQAPISRAIAMLNTFLKAIESQKVKLSP